MSLGNKIVMYIFAAGMAGLALWLLNSAAHWNGGLTWAATAAFALLMFAGAGFLVMESTKQSVVIDDQSLTVTHAFSARSVLLEEIAGYQQGSKGTFWLDLKSGNRRVMIPTTIASRKEAIGWLKEKYPDMDAALAQQVTQEVLHDERFGSTEEERAKKLMTARRLMVYSALAPMLLILVIINPQPFMPLMLLLLAIPLVCGWLTWYYKGILRI